MKFPSDADTGEYLNQADAATWAKTNGIIGRPSPPRNLLAQSGSRKVLVTWDAPESMNEIIGYRIYTVNENALLDSIYDPNVRQYSVPTSSGATPPVINIFISSFSKRDESAKVQVQGSATAEAGAPSDPPPPAGSAASGDTGKSVGVDGGESDAGFTR